MDTLRRIELIEAQLECADKSIQAAIGNMSAIAGNGDWVGSLGSFKKLVSVHLRLLHLKLSCRMYINHKHQIKVNTFVGKNQ